MVAVLVLAALCEIFMGIYVSTEIKGKYLSATFLKGTASLFFVLIGLICSPGGKTADLIVLGLILGAIADVLLNLQYVINANGKIAFALGAFLFLVGHVAYFAAIFPLVQKRALFVILGIIVSAIQVVILFKRVNVDKVMMAFGIVYLSFVTILDAVAIGGFITNPTGFYGLFALGIFLFHVSDVVLIVNHFGKEVRDSLRILNGVLYYTGQILVAISLIAL